MNIWDERFYNLALTVSSWSKDPNKKVGCVIVRQDRTISSMGYNGFPRGVTDDQARLDYRSLKNKLMVHAEANAIINSQDTTMIGHTLYCTSFCCCACTGLIIQKGISRLVVPEPDVKSTWYEDFVQASKLLKEVGVQVNYV